jgi:Arc/MetJ-type ribon-helix-helix transcriptional regulator
MPRTKAQEKMVLLSVHLPKQLLEEIDNLVAQGLFPSRSEAIRTAVWELVRRESQRRDEDTQIMTGR